MSPVLVIAPTGLPVSLAEAKSHLRVDHGDDDIHIEMLLNAATAYLDGWSGILGRALLLQSYEIKLPGFPSADLAMPLPDVRSATIGYLAVDGTEAVLPDDAYAVKSQGENWFLTRRSVAVLPSVANSAPNPVTLTFECGYGAVEDVPSPLKLAILFLAAHWYDRREVISADGHVDEIPLGFRAMVAPYKTSWLT